MTVQAFDQQYYTDHHLGEDRLALWWYARVVRRLWPAGGRLFDFGCGTGGLLKRLSPHFETFGYDPSPFARMQCRSNAPDATILEEWESVPAGSFEVVVALHTLEHLPRPLPTLRRLVHTLVPDGTLFFVVPNPGGVGRSLKGRQWFAYRDPTHVSLLSQGEWMTLVRSARPGGDGGARGRPLGSALCVDGADRGAARRVRCPGGPAGALADRPTAAAGPLGRVLDCHSLQALLGPPAMTGSESRWKRPAVGVVAILVLAAAVRLTNLAWDQTHFFHPDERAVASAVLRVSFRPLQLNPQFFAYGSLPIYLAKITSSVAATVDSWAAGYDGVILNGRRMSAVIGVLTVLVLIGVGRRLYGDAVGLLAGLLLAACALHIQNSRFLTVDVSLTFFVLLALAQFLRVSAEGRWRDFVWAGVAVGCAVATKFSAMPLLLPFGIAALHRWRVERRFLPVAGRAAGRVPRGCRRVCGRAAVRVARFQGVLSRRARAEPDGAQRRAHAVHRPVHGHAQVLVRSDPDAVGHGAGAGSHRGVGHRDACRRGVARRGAPRSGSCWRGWCPSS